MLDAKLKLIRFRARTQLYFSDCREELADQNRRLLRLMAPAYLLSLLAYLLAVCLPQGNDAQTMVLLNAAGVQGAFVLVVLLGHLTTPRRVDAALLFFGGEILFLGGWLGVVIFPSVPALLFPLMLILMTQIYTLSPGQILLVVLGGGAGFLLFSGMFKAPGVFAADAVATVVASAIGLVSYCTTLHYKTDAYITRRDLRRMCSLDGMTGVLNKTSFEYYAAAVLRSQGPKELTALAVVDLDHFKQINDHFGHKRGDEVLLACSGALQKIFPAADDCLVGRFGGDEFVVLLRRLTGAERAEQSFRQLERELSAACGEVTCSVGVAVADEPETTFSQLFLEADRMLYAAKNQGGAQVCVSHFSAESEHAPLLLVRDELESDRALLHRCFADTYRLLESGSRRELLTMVQRYRDGLSAIILDLDLALEDTVALIAKLRRLPGMRTVPIVALTAYTGEGVTAEQLGVQAVLLRPLSGEELKSVLERVIKARTAGGRRSAGR